MVASKLTWFFCEDRIWLRFSAGNEIGCFLCGGSKLTVCGPKLACFCVWSIDSVSCVKGRSLLGFCMRAENRLVLVWVVEKKLDFSVGDRPFINEQNRSLLQIPVSGDWVAQCFIRYKQAKEDPGSNPNQVVFPLFLKCISTQQPGPQQNPLKNRSTSQLYSI